MFLFICNPRYEFNSPYSRLRGNDKSGVCLGNYSPLSSRAERGDPVNKKKALRANARRHIKTGLPQSYDNVFNVVRTPSQ